MRTLTSLLLWCILFVLCWPLAVLALLAWPIIWIITLPFRLVGVVFTGLFACLYAIITLPAKLLGWKPQTA